MADRIPSSFMADELMKLAFSKRGWLRDFSGGRNRRPDHEIETRKRELDVLNQAAEDYRRAAERDAA